MVRQGTPERKSPGGGGFSLALRMAIGCALCTAVVLVGAFAALRQSTEDTVRASFIGMLGQSAQANAQVVRTRQNEMEEGVVMLAGDAEVEAIASGARRAGDETPGTLTGDAAAMIARTHPEFWIVTDPAGTVIAAHGSAATPAVGASLSNLPVVRAALVGDSTARRAVQGLHFRGAIPLQLVAAPIVSHGFVSGAVVVGEAMPMAIADSDAGYLMLVAGDTVLAGSRDLLRPDRHWIPKWVQFGGSSPVLTLNGEEYVSAKVAAGAGDDGRPVDLYLMRSVTDATEPVLADLRERFLLVAALAALLIGVTAAATARITLRPLTRFVRFVRGESNASEYTQYDESMGSAELSALVRVYNRLMATIDRNHDELHERAVALAASNERLQRVIDDASAPMPAKEPIALRGQTVGWQVRQDT